MARRKVVAPGTSAPRTAAGVLLPEDVIGYRPESRGPRTPETTVQWLQDRAAWRERHPGEALPVMGSLDLHMLMSFYMRGKLDEDLYRAERRAPVDRQRSA